MAAKLTSRIPQIVEELPVKAGIAEARTAGQVAALARERAPRLRSAIIYDSFKRYPGQLADSIGVEHEGTAGSGAMEVVVDEFYGRFVEHGTRFMHAEPYLEPAAEANMARFADTVSGALRTL